MTLQNLSELRHGCLTQVELSLFVEDGQAAPQLFLFVLHSSLAVLGHREGFHVIIETFKARFVGFAVCFCV